MAGTDNGIAKQHRIAITGDQNVGCDPHPEDGDTHDHRPTPGRDREVDERPGDDKQDATNRHETNDLPGGGARTQKWYRDRNC